MALQGGLVLVKSGRPDGQTHFKSLVWAGIPCSAEKNDDR